MLSFINYSSSFQKWSIIFIRMCECTWPISPVEIIEDDGFFKLVYAYNYESCCLSLSTIFLQEGGCLVCVFTFQTIIFSF